MSCSGPEICRRSSFRTASIGSSGGFTRPGISPGGCSPISPNLTCFATSSSPCPSISATTGMPKDGASAESCRRESEYARPPSKHGFLQQPSDEPMTADRPTSGSPECPAGYNRCSCRRTRRSRPGYSEWDWYASLPVFPTPPPAGANSGSMTGRWWN